jgi:hypothetical protein
MRSQTKTYLFFTCILFSSLLHAQEEDMKKLLEEEKPKKEYVTMAFKSSRVIMSHSLEMLKPGVLDFRILHRFGNINYGLGEFFGLDQATIRLGLDYGISKDLTIGIGRATYKKELDGFIKYRPIQQSKGPGSTPFSLLLIGGTTLSTLNFVDTSIEDELSSRMAYYGQVVIGRKFNEAITIQLMPTLLHRNLVVYTSDPNELFAVGFGGRLKLSKRVSFNVDYYYVVNQNEERTDLYNPLSIGFDIETGGHVFQLHFTNAIGMNERAFLSETTNDWGQGDIQFGFNISRAFQIGGKKKETSTY